MHLYLSDPDPEVRLGNLLGDFVKGRLVEEEWSEGMLRGLRQHRAVDSFSRISPAVRNSCSRLDPAIRLFRPVLVDVFYDHLLASRWDVYHPEPLPRFAAGIYALFRRYEKILPDNFKDVARRMAQHDWLTSYANPGIVPLVLQRMGRRVRQGELLARGAAELPAHRAGLESDCRQFIAEARHWLANAPV